MRKTLSPAFTVMFILALALSLGCANKTRQALKDAEAAIAQAESASASQKSPEVYNQAQKHFEQGRQYEFLFHYGLARVEYEAAAADARLALALSSGQGAPALGTIATETWPAVPPAANDGCCVELNLCNDKQQFLRDQLEQCERSAPIRTRVIREPCADKEVMPAAAPAFGQPLIGTLLVESPESIVKGKSDYKIKVKFVRSQLDPAAKGKIETKYTMLLDVEAVDPPEVEVFSPTSDFEPLDAHGGEWLLDVKTPEDLTQEVKVKVLATLRNPANLQEMKLPAVTVVVPNASACPACPKCPQVEMGKAEKPAGEKVEAQKDWTMRLILLIIGLGLGLAAGFFVFGRLKKSGSTIKIGD